MQGLIGTYRKGFVIGDIKVCKGRERYGLISFCFLKDYFGIFVGRMVL